MSRQPAKDFDAAKGKPSLRHALSAAVLSAGLLLTPASNAQAGEAHAATAGERGLDGVQGMRDMRHFSEDANTKGIGIFINVQANASAGYGDRIGQALKSGFGKRGIAADYRINQSRGTATDITFYVQGYDFTVNIDDLRAEIPRIFAHYGDLWKPEQVSLNAQPQ